MRQQIMSLFTAKIYRNKKRHETFIKRYHQTQEGMAFH